MFSLRLIVVAYGWFLHNSIRRYKLGRYMSEAINKERATLLLRFIRNRVEKNRITVPNTNPPKKYQPVTRCNQTGTNETATVAAAKINAEQAVE